MKSLLKSLMTEVEIEIDGRTVKGFAALKNGVLWTHAGGESWTTNIGGTSRRGSKAKRGGVTNPGEIMAPMPGKIIKVSSPVGTKVSQGDVVVVMEAMKMEYTLKAQADGVVSEVLCAAGDQVTLGALIAKLKV